MDRVDPLISDGLGVSFLWISHVMMMSDDLIACRGAEIVARFETTLSMLTIAFVLAQRIHSSHVGAVTQKLS